MSGGSFERLFHPRGVAVFGSVKENKIAHQIFTQMVRGGLCRLNGLGQPVGGTARGPGEDRGLRQHKGRTLRYGPGGSRRSRPVRGSEPLRLRPKGYSLRGSADQRVFGDREYRGGEGTGRNGVRVRYPAHRAQLRGNHEYSLEALRQHRGACPARADRPCIPERCCRGCGPGNGRRAGHRIFPFHKHRKPGGRRRIGPPGLPGHGQGDLPGRSLPGKRHGRP